MSARNARTLLRGISLNDVVVVDSTVEDNQKPSMDRQSTFSTASISTSDSQAWSSDDDASVLDKMSDDDLIAKADWHMKEEQHLAAGRFLRKVENRSLLKESHLEALQTSKYIQEVISVHRTPPTPENGWKKQSENHGKFDSACYFQFVGDDMTVRLEVILPKDLRAPFLAVLSEVDSWSTWMPRLTFPVKMGVGKTESLHQHGRFNQYIRAILELPIISNREVVMDSVISDCVDDENCFCICVKSFDEDDNRGGLIPPPEGERIFMQLDLMLQSCTPAHPLLKKSKKNYDPNEQLTLLSFTGCIRPNINIFARNFFTPLLYQGLRIAEDARDGKREKIKSMMEQNKEKYDWFVERCDKMLMN